MEESLKIHRFNILPSAVEFASQIESRNVPAVFNGCIKNWKAFSLWNPTNGGLDYLQERVGSSIVEAMLSKSAPVFYGDLRSHERVPLPFSAFIGFCKQHFQSTDCDVYLESERQGVAGLDTEFNGLLYGDDPQQIYLAQVPIMNMENEERVQLETLREDIQTPAFLETKALACINLWMNNARARSSTHYDPHHNLLCIVAGCKQVVLWPPSASPLLYPKPIYGEASNHSSVALENPNFSIHPRAERLMEFSQKVDLHEGDALFIPEGWFHQVDSDDLTIAVNFWWQSNVMSRMSEHMDAYYLRRILRRLTDKEMNEVLRKIPASMRDVKKHTYELPNKGEADQQDCEAEQKCENKNLIGTKLNQRIIFHKLEPLALRVLHELVSLVHDRINVADQSKPEQSTSRNDSTESVKGPYKKIEASNLFRLEDDPIAEILGTLEPPTLQNVFLAMAHNFPRTLEALILHLLSPVGAEVLTRKFEEMDQQIAEDDRSEFYRAFYGVFDDQFAAMDAILNGKELFALQAFKNVLAQCLGLNFDGPTPAVG